MRIPDDKIPPHLWAATLILLLGCGYLFLSLQQQHDRRERAREQIEQTIRKAVHETLKIGQ